MAILKHLHGSGTRNFIYLNLLKLQHKVGGLIIFLQRESKILQKEKVVEIEMGIERETDKIEN